MTPDIPMHGSPRARPPAPKKVEKPGPVDPGRDVIPPEGPREPSPERPPNRPIPRERPPVETAEDQ